MSETTYAVIGFRWSRSAQPPERRSATYNSGVTCQCRKYFCLSFYLVIPLRRDIRYHRFCGLSVETLHSEFPRPFKPLCIAMHGSGRIKLKHPFSPPPSHPASRLPIRSKALQTLSQHHDTSTPSSTPGRSESPISELPGFSSFSN